MKLAHMVSRVKSTLGGRDPAVPGSDRDSKASGHGPRAGRSRAILERPAVGVGHVTPAGEVPVRAKPSEAMRRRIRERYLAVRFPGSPNTDDELRNSRNVVKAARLYFEDGDLARACELLDFATDVNPGDEAPWLAHLEMLFLRRKAEAFRDVARRFHDRFPASPRWEEVARLGLRLAPEDALFRDVHLRQAPADEHFGLWPPGHNWIQAPFDLTGDVLAAEFHARMRGGSVTAPITAKVSGT